MYFYFVPSLQHIAVTKIVIALWNEAEISSLVAKFDCSQLNINLISRKSPDPIMRRWKKIEDKVTEKISQIPELGPFKETILNIVKPIGDQILHWKVYTETFCGFQFCLENFPKELCFTPQGVLDKRKTAQVLVEDIAIPESERFRLASLYCIESNWSEIYTYPRREDLINSDEFEDRWKLDVDAFVRFWTFNMTGDASGLADIIGRSVHNTPYQCAAEWAVYYMNKEAVEYYLNKLTGEERREFLFDIRLENCKISKSAFKVFQFLLVQMDEQQQLKLFGEFPCHVLGFLLVWPWQGLFMEMANRVWEFLHGPQYAFLLIAIIEKVMDGYKDCDYQEIFGRFWVESPMTLKTDVIDFIRDRHKVVYFDEVLWKLFVVNDAKNISLFLEVIPMEDKEDILFSKEGIRICENLVKSDKWSLLKLFINRCITSRQVMIMFRDECKANGDFSEAFFQFIEELIENCTELKRIQSKKTI